MTALVIAIALVIGVAFSEVMLRNVGEDAWAVRRLAAVRNELQSFQKANDDDARQHHLIRGGVATLTLSLAVLAAIAVCALLFAAPMFVLAWSERQSTIYLVVSGIGAIAWWMLRRARRRP